MKRSSLLGKACKESFINGDKKHERQDWIRVTGMSGLVSKKKNINQ